MAFSTSFLPDGGLAGTVANLDGYLRPTGAIAETVPRVHVGSNLAAQTSGTLKVTAIPIEAGRLITSISFLSGTTALGTATNQWFVLANSSRVRLGITSDDTDTAWGANTVKTLNLATPYQATYSGLYYVGILVAAGTMPSLRGFTSGATSTGIVPILTGTSTTGLTDPASCPSTLGAISATADTPYAYVS